MNLAILAIRAYQRIRFVNRSVRLAVAVHHRLRKPRTRPCPYAPQCSASFAERARGARLGGLAVLPSVLAAMSVCGPGLSVDESTHCRPSSSLGTESFCDKIIRASLMPDPNHYRSSCGSVGGWFNDGKSWC